MKSIAFLHPKALVSLLAALSLAGCAAGGATKSTETLAQRVEARWDHLVNKAPEKAWDYLSPGAKKVTPRDQYVRETMVKPVQWTGVEYLSEECDSPDVCDVLVRVQFRVRSHLTGVGMLDAERRLEERWIRVGGAWYFLPKEQ